MSDDTKPTEPLSEARLEELRALREVPWPTWFDTYGTGVQLLDGRPGAPHRCLASIDAEDDDNEDEARPLTRAYGKALVAHPALLAEVDRLKVALAEAERQRDADCIERNMAAQRLWQALGCPAGGIDLPIMVDAVAETLGKLRNQRDNARGIAERAHATIAATAAMPVTHQQHLIDEAVVAGWRKPSGSGR